MKKLTKFFIKSFIGPFLATFFISMFMLVMQFLWKYIDDLMGKGLEVSVILELLFYVSASLLPLALPLAILLSSLMVMGNLGEQLELTALKSSGMSINRILRPLTGIIILIAIGTFYFSNYVIPVANYKWHSIIFDIQEKKMSSFLRPGIYTQEIDGFSIKIKDGKDNKFNDIIIHDRRVSNEIKTIVADSGAFLQSENGEFLFFKLYHGHVIEELSQGSDFQGEDKQSSSFYPSRKSDFKTATYKMDMSGFKLQRTKDDLFKDDYEMLNVFQINRAADSIQKLYLNLKDGLALSNKSKHSYFKEFTQTEEADSLQKQLIEKYKARNHAEKNKTTEKVAVVDSLNRPKKLKKGEIIPPIYSFSDMSKKVRESAINNMKSQLRTNIQSLNNQQLLIQNREKTMRRFEIEFHRKFALSFAIIILFFIGAPLGAIVKRGGFGAPVVIALLLFMIYYVLMTIGNEMAKNDVISPAVGMWAPNFILTPFAVLLMISAAHDGNMKFLTNLFKRKKKNA